jgi:hypothetical protein
MAWSNNTWLGVVLGAGILVILGLSGIATLVFRDISTPEYQAKEAVVSHQNVVTAAKRAVSDLVYVQDEIGNCYAFASIGGGMGERSLFTQINCSPRVLEAI